MNARSRFQVGDLVTYSERGKAAFAHAKNRSDMGIVAGFSREPEIVRVLRDGHKTPEAYHESFWQLRTENGSVKP